jgi:hypothetical protein
VCYASFARRIAGSRELVGTDVIRMQRLLKNSVAEDIVDYKPPRHTTHNERNPIGRMRWSSVLEPLDGGGTRLTLSGQLLDGAPQRAKLVFARRIINREVGASFDALMQYGDRVAAEG